MITLAVDHDLATLPFGRVTVSVAQLNGGLAAMAMTDELSDHVAAIKQLHKATLEHAIEIGRRLLLCKAKVPHGKWKAWLRDELDFSPCTFSHYARIVKFCDSKEYDKVEFMRLGPYSIAQIAQADTIVIDQIAALGRAKMTASGKSLTHKEIKDAAPRRPHGPHRVDRETRMSPAEVETVEANRNMLAAFGRDLRELANEYRDFVELIADAKGWTVGWRIEIKTQALVKGTAPRGEMVAAE